MGGGCTKPKERNSIQEDCININLSLDNKGMYEFKKIVGKGGFGRVWKVT